MSYGQMCDPASFVPPATEDERIVLEKIKHCEDCCPECLDLDFHVRCVKTTVRADLNKDGIIEETEILGTLIAPGNP